MRALAIDQGTTSTRALVVDEAGVTTVHSVEHRQFYPAPEHVEHDPEELIANLRERGVAIADRAKVRLLIGGHWALQASQSWPDLQPRATSGPPQDQKRPQGRGRGKVQPRNNTVQVEPQRRLQSGLSLCVAHMPSHVRCTARLDRAMSCWRWRGTRTILWRRSSACEGARATARSGRWASPTKRRRSTRTGVSTSQPSRSA